MNTKKHDRITQLLLILFTISCTTLTLNAQEEELSEMRTFNSFKELTATNGVNILLRKSSEEKAEVRITNGLLTDVITEVSNGTLKIKMRPQINKELTVLVVVYYKSLHEITITKGASLETKSVMLTDNLKLSAKTGGTIKAEIECNEVKVNAFGGAEVSLYGWAKRLEISANTKSNILAKTLNADKALVRVATGAEAWIKPKDYLEAVANTGGTIFYTSTPEKKNEKTSSGGEVINKVVKIGNDLIRNVDE